MDANDALYSALWGNISYSNFGKLTKSEFDDYYYDRYKKLSAKYAMLGIKLEIYIGIGDYFLVRRNVDSKNYYGLISFKSAKIMIPIEYTTIIGIGPDLFGYIEASKGSSKYIFDRKCNLLGSKMNAKGNVKFIGEINNYYPINVYSSASESVLIDFSGIYYKHLNHSADSFELHNDTIQIEYTHIDMNGCIRKFKDKASLFEFDHIELTEDELEIIKNPNTFMKRSLFKKYNSDF